MPSLLDDQNGVEVIEGISAWYLPTNDDIVKNDPGMPHETNNKVSLECLNSLGVLSTNVNNPAEWQNDERLTKIRNKRGYHSFDEVVFDEPLKDEQKGRFFSEHLHTDEEIRFLSHGIGYFDIRDTHDKWIRVMIGPGVLIILPAGMWHRFYTSTEKNETTYPCIVHRLFTTEPHWRAFHRLNTDNMTESDIKEMMMTNNKYIQSLSSQ